jgi:hypothetical protein
LDDLSCGNYHLFLDLQKVELQFVLQVDLHLQELGYLPEECSPPINHK